MKSLVVFKVMAILIFISFISMMNQQNAFAGLSHYVPGSSGIKISSVGPPGFWYADYSTFYTSDTYKDDNGLTDIDMTLFAHISQFIWITEKKFLGADYGMDLHVPLVYTDISLKVGGATVADDKRFGLGDLFVDPLILSWHKPRWDAVVLSGIFLPTAKHDQPASPGKGYWTFMHQVGGTYYLDQAKTWSASTRLRFLHSTEDPDTDIRAGNETIIEYGFGKDIMLKGGSLLTLGFYGYSYFQLTKDSGTGASPLKTEGHAIGPEIQWTLFKPFVNLSLMYTHEYGVENNAQGDLACFRVVCMF